MTPWDFTPRRLVSHGVGGDVRKPRALGVTCAASMGDSGQSPCVPWVSGDVPPSAKSVDLRAK